MVFQSYAYGSTNPINLHPGGDGMGAAHAFPMPFGGGGGSKKRKAVEDREHDFSLSSLHSNKLCLPRSAGLAYDAPAQFHPLPEDVSNAILAAMPHDSFAALGSSVTGSPSSSYAPSLHSAHGHEHRRSDGSDYFSASAQYPQLDIYPRQQYGLLGPQAGAATAGMDVDGAEPTPQGHGPHCKSIPRLSVRHNGGTSSELWASCPDCGACTKVQSDEPATNLCYSP